MKSLVFLLLLPALLIGPRAGAAVLPGGVNVLGAGDLETRCITAVVIIAGVPEGTTVSDEDRLAAEGCSAYFSAFNEMLMALRDHGVTPMGICYPSVPQPPVTLMKLFIGFIERHPEAKTSLAMPVALAAAAEAMPCSTGPKPK